MKCPHCDYELVPGARFCDACGQPVQSENPVIPPAPVISPPPDVTAPPIANPFPVANAPETVIGPSPEAEAPRPPLMMVNSIPAVETPRPSQPVINAVPEAPRPPQPIAFPGPAVQPLRPAAPQGAPQPVNFNPVVNYAPPVPAGPAAPEKIMGIPVAQLGTITLVLGIAGLALSCVGCGGIFSIGGLITGFLGMKNSSGSNSKIGMILSGVGLLVSIVAICVMLYMYSNSQNSVGY